MSGNTISQDRRTLAITAFAVLLSLSPVDSASSDDPLRSEIAAISLRSNVWLVTGAGGTILLASDDESSFAVDTGLASTAPEIVELFERTAGRLPDFVVNTHWHPDHVEANDSLRARGSRVIAHESARTRLTHDNRDHDGSILPMPDSTVLPDVTFSQSTTLHVAGQTIRCFHVPGAHTDGDIFVHFVEANVLHMGDVFKNGRFTYFDVDSGGSIDGFIAAQELALSIANDDTIIVPGHGTIGKRADLARELATLRKIRAVMEPLIADHTLEDVRALDPYADFPTEWAKDAYARSLMVRTVYGSLAASR